jgi:hypothetical protein
VGPASLGLAVIWAVSGSCGGGLVLLDHAGGDPAAVADYDALFSRPRPDTAAALTGGCASPWPAARCPAGFAGALGHQMVHRAQALPRLPPGYQEAPCRQRREERPESCPGKEPI